MFGLRSLGKKDTNPFTVLRVTKLQKNGCKPRFGQAFDFNKDVVRVLEWTRLRILIKQRIPFRVRPAVSVGHTTGRGLRRD